MEGLCGFEGARGSYRAEEDPQQLSKDQQNDHRPTQALITLVDPSAIFCNSS